jgi:hypothetical protein
MDIETSLINTAANLDEVLDEEMSHGLKFKTNAIYPNYIFMLICFLVSSLLIFQNIFINEEQFQNKKRIISIDCSRHISSCQLESSKSLASSVIEKIVSFSLLFLVYTTYIRGN